MNVLYSSRKVFERVGDAAVTWPADLFSIKRAGDRFLVLQTSKHRHTTSNKFDIAQTSPG